jgi:tetratricopeptide (TPR) repeat protein
MPQSAQSSGDLTGQCKESMKHIRLSLFCSALILACSVSALAADEIAVARKGKRPAAAAARADDARYADQPGALVYQVLLAEIALQRGDAQLASTVYADLALRTNDPKVLERTVEVAGYARRFDLALDAARRWVEVDPESKRAQQLLVSVMILSNQFDDLAPTLVRMLETDRGALAENLLGLNRMFARNPDRAAVFRLVDKVCQPFFGTAEAHYAVAMAASSAGLRERALSETRRALELRPDWEMAALLEVQLLLRDSPGEAISLMRDFLTRNPQARDLELVLARVLIGERQYGEARRHFDVLLKEFPDSPEVVYPAAMLALQQNDRDFAETQLKHLLTLNLPDKNLAYYYLGQLAEDAKRNDEALAYYASVGAGEQYLAAQIRRARLFAAQGLLDAARSQLKQARTATPEERIQLLIAEAALLRDAKQTQAALDLLEQALSNDPDQPDLLYESALLAEKLGRMEILESRLRRLIELRPDSAQAYNALGYSYADRNLRLTEARELIEKALALSPDDTFIIDSLGWVLYRQGDLAGALSALERAYAQRDDPEIAAHLGEVLSTLGRADEARRILTEAHKKYPDSDTLTDAVKKFAP